MDRRSDFERTLWDRVGPPLYYCADCLRAVKVTPVEGAEPIIDRPCDDSCEGAGIIAPRKAIVAGEGGLNWTDAAKVKYWQIAAALTGRCV
jgi:hypothetical protein